MRGNRGWRHRWIKDARRYSQLAQLLRSHTLVDVDCWSRVPGSPIAPMVIEQQLRRRLQPAKKEN